MSENTLRLYHELAWLWPLWQEPSAYAFGCEHARQLITQYSRIPVRSLLDMGCGGGMNASNLKQHFEVTGIDISQPMLDLATELNPECTFVQADMRTCDLGRQFDAIFVDDAITYMLTRDDLAALFATAWNHLRAGGVMIVAPDDTKETFEQNSVRVSTANSPRKPADLDVTFIENEYDPDPDDDTTEFTLVYLIRKDGRLSIEIDHDLGGLFTLEAWRSTLRDAGFDVHELPNPEDGASTMMFACVKPV